MASTGQNGWAILAQRMKAELARFEREGRLRSLSIPPVGPDLIDLTHNDYLGLRANTEFQRRAHEAARRWPVGAGASRLLGGEHAIFTEIEEQFAAFKGAEAALFFPSGYAANEALAQALRHDGAVFLSDELNHASIIDGLRLARLDPGAKQIFPHCATDEVAKAIKRADGAYHVVVTESLYSMDGDIADLSRLAAICEETSGVLVVDEAHAVGVYGPEGRGLIAAQGVDHAELISVNTCGKALGVSGAFIAGPRWLRDYLINAARPFIYTTAPSPWVAAALSVALTMVPAMDEERKSLAARAAKLRHELETLGFKTGAATSHIIPILCGSSPKAVELARFLERHGILAKAIRPPTVAPGSERVRLSLHAGLDTVAVERIIAAFRQAKEAFHDDL